MIVDARTLPTAALAGPIAAMERDLFGTGAWSEASVLQELTAPSRYYVVDLDGPNGTLRGYAGFWFDGYDAQVMTVGVARDHQGHGLGGALLDELVREARARGAERLLLEVGVDNAAAIHLYESRGFTHMGLRKRYYQPEGVDAYTMSLELRPHVMGFTAPTQENQ
ncbi:MAG: ribosomal protein S18-alanine N-acetyltransferase [Bifidobacterium sp.]|nr:ribosomal protein S18-alanine N-acetyltransferase [Bifidobacterium sp.]